MSPEPVIKHEWLARVESIYIRLQTALQVGTMDAFGPPISEFLLERAPGEVQPGLVEERAQLVHPRHPNHHGRRIGDDPEASFALALAILGLLARESVDKNLSDQPLS